MTKYIIILIGHAMFLVTIFFLVKDVLHAYEPTRSQAFFVVLFMVIYVVAMVRNFFPRYHEEWDPV